MATQSFIIAAKRTPFGAFGGKLKDLTANELGGIAAKAAIDSLPAAAQAHLRQSTSPRQSVIFGNVLQTSTDAPYLARHVGHRAGLPVTTPANTVNRLCTSGFQSIINAVQEIKSDDADIVVTGGSESMSQAPYALRNVRWGAKFGPEYLKMEDTLMAALTDRYPTSVPMAITAERLATKYSVTREECDKFAVQSQQRWAQAHEAGVFASEIAPIEVKVKRAIEQMACDEHPRPQTTIEGLARLGPVFQKDGVVTAGNASGISDGASAVIVASEGAVKQHGIAPLARIVSYHVVGVEPGIMGIGPVEAIRGAVEKAGLSIGQMDLIEINEAFAAQVLSCAKALDIDPAKLNASGGAIALGHPLGASGSRIMGHLAHRLKETGGRYAVGSACAGGGQGVAIVIEAL
ncbi:3-ketoacyl-CoA thiolase, mitochondrial [Coemansia sp. RSA 2706]|nr:3-ketoacyl-CoA thiolase, mitochondrial [Coemansia sp. RSA 2711]KAJ1840952.1 3-ketoacyl-CoA thiolase, mitochondrial [Coemansia sp. RSA 2708]KAJ2307558.1 3-ketoacyl-CoA thiolase, mitochondrial [Coemansia sp. RSA 2706]KAJ2313808.1 3-ketoacyl-CoA thiolase, mitochondrial [Coemansia sp. RSA 2705]KAJ2319728.1 3-ketoacyl-CoA thiolase, mitochondrial [Coemansia sp. RSA 2704]KAJ2326325.1 3-ketoacyl-CoA thiolase, mitochondrial [Coemansia sp. RSA 2702]KAJ2737265.1 3-ketoacyl-CoA thiolase, mitochondrial